MCTKCLKTLPLDHFGVTRPDCKACRNKQHTEYRNSERGYLKDMYYGFGTRRGCHFTFKEFFAAYKKHRSVYGMKSAWGLGPPNLDEHLEMTMKKEGEGRRGKPGGIKGHKVNPSNLSVDRINSAIGYTLQNIIFIRTDENRRKNSSTYKDAIIHQKIYEDRFIKMKAI